MYSKVHKGKNVKTTDFTKEIIRRAAKSMNTSEIKLVATIMEQEFPRIAKSIEVGNGAGL